MKKILITGASGFVGGYLSEHLLSNHEFDVHGTYHSDESLQSSPVKDTIQFHHADLEQKESITSLIHEVKPDFIFHLAAQANVPASFKNPVQTFHANIDSQIYLLDALRSADMLHSRVLIVGSAEEYGYVRPEELPVDELTPLRPANPYSVSKIAQDYLALQYFISYKMPIIRVRPFNHIGPRQKAGYVTSDFAKQIALIEKGEMEPVIKVGNLEAKRDFTDVRDMVKAYAMLIEKGEPGEGYNIGSGNSHKIQEILDIFLSFAKVKITVETDQEKLRPSDIPEIVCDSKKVNEITGWKPEIAFEKTLQDILDYWRQIV